MGEWEVSPTLVEKLDKSALILNVIFNSFQEKKPGILPYSVFLSRVVHDCSPKYPNSKKTHLTYLVTGLGWLLLLMSVALVNICLSMEQKQLSSNTKIKKKCTSVLHSFSAHFKNQTTRRTVDSLDLLPNTN